MASGLKTSLDAQKRLQQKLPDLTNGLSALNSKAQEVSQKAAAFEDAINSVNLSDIENAVGRLEQTEKDLRQFKKKLSDLKNSLDARDDAVKKVIKDSDFLTDEQKAKLVQLLNEKLPKADLPDLDNIVSQLPSGGDIQLPDMSVIKKRAQRCKSEG